MPLAAQDVPSVKVAYRDLNLTTPEGTAAFNGRIAHAIAAMCGSTDSRDLATLSAAAHCRSVAKASASPQVAMLVDRAQQLARRDDGNVRIASR